MGDDDEFPVSVERRRYRGAFGQRNVFVICETPTDIHMTIAPYPLAELLMEHLFAPGSALATGVEALRATGTLDSERLDVVSHDASFRSLLPEIIRKAFGTRYADENLVEFWNAAIYVDSRPSEWGTVKDVLGPLGTLH